MMKNSISIVLLFVSALMFGQQAKVETPYIQVTGTAEKKIVPDEIYISITIKERMEGKDKLTIEEQEKALKGVVVKLGIDIKNLTLANANADYMKVRLLRKGVISQTEYVLKVINAKEVGDVFVQLGVLKIKDAYIMKVAHSHMEKYKKETNILAIKAAKEKADYLLQAIGEETGKPLSVSGNYDNVQSNNRNRSNNRAKTDMVTVRFDKEVSEIEFRQIELKVTIHVKFAIK